MVDKAGIILVFGIVLALALNLRIDKPEIETVISLTCETDSCCEAKYDNDFCVIQKATDECVCLINDRIERLPG